LTPLGALPYGDVWVVDFEFIAKDGERPDPVCMVARELRGGRLIRLWRDDLLRLSRAPFPADGSVLFVAYFASAELGCFLALGWPMPLRILDLYTEFRVKTNGLPVPRGKGLLGALAFHGLDSMDAEEKAAMRSLILSGGPWSHPERQAILDYCQADVDALARLLPRMLPAILGHRNWHANLGRALLRGRYMAAVARLRGFARRLAR
jgi:DNA polymerase-1